MSTGRRILVASALVIATALAMPGTTAAHETSTVELRLDAGEQRLEAELDLVDLDFVLGLRSAGGRQLTAGDVRQSQHEIRRYVGQNLQLESCTLSAAPGSLGLREGYGPRVVVGFDLDCGRRDGVFVLQSTVFDELPGYRTLLTVDGESGRQLHVAEGGNLSFEFEQSARFAGFGSFLAEGVTHILGGFDHLLFLLLLILPLIRRASFRECFLSVAGIVTAFTVAHSITLTLSSRGYLALPAQPVEILIAASVVLVAVMNVLGRGDRIAWPLAYVFGLVHGFGFAGAFAELASGSAIRWTDLLAFNIGVEAGQLLVIALALAVLRPVSRLRFARPVLIPAGSLVAGFIGAIWIVERL